MAELADAPDLGRVTSVKVFITRANLKIKYAGMVELVDTQDLGSCAAMRVGSSPTTRTITDTVIDTIVLITVSFFMPEKALR